MKNQQEAAVAEEKRKSESKDEDGEEEEGEADNWEDNWDAASDGSDDTPAPPEFVIDQVKGYRQRNLNTSIQELTENNEFDTLWFCPVFAQTGVLVPTLHISLDLFDLPG